MLNTAGDGQNGMDVWLFSDCIHICMSAVAIYILPRGRVLMDYIPKSTQNQWNVNSSQLLSNRIHWKKINRNRFWLMGEHIIVCVNDVDDQINRRRKNRYHTLLNCQFLPNMNMHEVLHLKCIPMSYTHRIQHMPKSILFFFNSILLCNICSRCARFFFFFLILSRKVVCVNVFERKTDTTRCGRCALKMKRQIKFID